MKERIYAKKECKYCGHIFDILIRGKTTSLRTDQDVEDIINKKGNNPYDYSFCSQCHLCTLQITLAYDIYEMESMSGI
jgi:hypothetical protein